jgi:hypothetical protein
MNRFSGAARLRFTPTQIAPSAWAAKKAMTMSVWLAVVAATRPPARTPSASRAPVAAATSSASSA